MKHEHYSHVNSPTKRTISFRMVLRTIYRNPLRLCFMNASLCLNCSSCLCLRFTEIMWSRTATFHKKYCLFLSIIQTTHTEKQINCLKPLKHMALCLIHNKQNISPICCRRAKHRVTKSENESLLWFALYGVAENGWAYVLVFNLSALWSYYYFLFTITRVLSVSMTTRSITCLQGSSLENSHQANKLWKASRDTAKYKHNCISLHKATPNTALTTDKLYVKQRERRKSVHLMKKPWLVGAHWTTWLEIR